MNFGYKWRPPCGNQAEISRDRIPHLLLATKHIAPHQTLSEAGIVDGSLLTLTFEATPPKLHSVVCKMSRMQATVEAMSLQAALDAQAHAVTEAQNKAAEAEAAALSLREMVAKFQAKLRSAEKASAVAQRQLEQAESWRSTKMRELQELQALHSDWLCAETEHLITMTEPMLCETYTKCLE